MKKIYSFVLMATMLLFSANTWAETIYVTDASELADAIVDANDGDVIIEGVRLYHV